MAEAKGEAAKPRALPDETDEQMLQAEVPTGGGPMGGSLSVTMPEWLANLSQLQRLGALAAAMLMALALIVTIIFRAGYHTGRASAPFEAASMAAIEAHAERVVAAMVAKQRQNAARNHAIGAAISVGAGALLSSPRLLPLLFASSTATLSPAPSVLAVVRQSARRVLRLPPHLGAALSARASALRPAVRGVLRLGPQLGAAVLRLGPQLGAALSARASALGPAVTACVHKLVSLRKPISQALAVGAFASGALRTGPIDANVFQATTAAAQATTAAAAGGLIFPGAGVVRAVLAAVAGGAFLFA